jgi:hypothetical protein
VVTISEPTESNPEPDGATKFPQGSMPRSLLAHRVAVGAVFFVSYLGMLTRPARRGQRGASQLRADRSRAGGA